MLVRQDYDLHACSRPSHCSPLSRLVSGEPEVERWPLQPGEDRFVVLASDGLWDVADTAAVVDVTLRFLPDGPQVFSSVRTFKPGAFNRPRP